MPRSGDNVNKSAQSTSTRSKTEKEIESKERRDSSITKKAVIEDAAAAKSGSLAGEFKRFEGQMNALFKKMESSIETKIDNLDTKFTTLFGELKTEIQGLKSEIQANTSDIESMTDRMSEFERSLQFQSLLVKDTDEKCMRKMKNMERKLDDRMKVLDQKLNFGRLADSEQDSLME